MLVDIIMVNILHYTFITNTFSNCGKCVSYPYKCVIHTVLDFLERGGSGQPPGYVHDANIIHEYCDQFDSGMVPHRIDPTWLYTRTKQFS